MAFSLIAVITGDLVGSRRRSAGEVDGAMRAIRAVAEAIGGWHSPAEDTRFTRFRGDGWQICLADPRFCLRAAVIIQGTLMATSMESRISIGIGQSESLGTANLADAAGDAFEKSGRGLDTIGYHLRLNISGKDVQIQDKIIADLLAERMQKWTNSQAEAVRLRLASPYQTRTLQDIAQELNISPQAVNDRLKSAGCATIESVLSRWEEWRGENNQEGRI